MGKRLLCLFGGDRVDADMRDELSVAAYAELQRSINIRGGEQGLCPEVPPSGKDGGCAPTMIWVRGKMQKGELKWGSSV